MQEKHETKDKQLDNLYNKFLDQKDEKQRN